MFFYVSAFCSHSERVLRIFWTPFWHLVDGIMELWAVFLALLVHLFPIYLFICGSQRRTGRPRVEGTRLRTPTGVLFFFCTFQRPSEVFAWVLANLPDSWIPGPLRKRLRLVIYLSRRYLRQSTLTEYRRTPEEFRREFQSFVETGIGQTTRLRVPEARWRIVPP
jgi:hypothetical protein